MTFSKSLEHLMRITPRPMSFQALFDALNRPQLVSLAREGATQTVLCERV